MAVPLTTLIRPVVALLAAQHGVTGGPAAEAMLIAIGLQESRFVHRDQVVPGKAPGQVGPATGYWQFERAGGVRGVMRHPASRDVARALADAAGVAWDEEAIWRLFATPEGDELACVFARLLLRTDPAALPQPVAAAEEEAWQYYLRNWRPGKPHRTTWGGFWAQAVSLAAGAPAPAPAATPAPPAAPSLEARIAALEVWQRRVSAATAG